MAQLILFPFFISILFACLAQSHGQTLTPYNNNSTQEPVKGILEGHSNSYKSGDTEAASVVTSQRDYRAEPSAQLFELNLNATTNVTTVSTDSSVLVLPSEVDWRQSNCILPPQHQSECFACSSFAALAVIEAAKCLKSPLEKRPPKRLAVQQLVDCFKGDGQFYGCNGGSMERLLPHLQQTNLIAYDECYKYKQRVGDCQLDFLAERYPECLTTAASNGFSKQFRYTKKLREVNDMLEHLALFGPIIGYMTVQDDFEHYVGDGVYTKQMCDIEPKHWDGGHFIAIVGYGTDAATGLDYWLIKNSWGPKWGSDGFGKVQRGVNACHIEHSSYGVL